MKTSRSISDLLNSKHVSKFSKIGFLRWRREDFPDLIEVGKLSSFQIDISQEIEKVLDKAEKTFNKGLMKEIKLQSQRRDYILLSKSHERHMQPDFQDHISHSRFLEE